MAGLGSRMKADKNKMLLMLEGKPIFMHTIDKFKSKNCDIILVVSDNDYEYIKSLNLPYTIAIGGKSRQESVYNGLLAAKTDRVLIHDGARCLVDDRIIDECLNSTSDAYFVGIRPKNTIRFDETKQYLTLNRNNLIEVQTPQGGNRELFLNAAKNIIENGIEVTDDISMLKPDTDIVFIEGSEQNIKITTPFDLKIAKCLMEDA